MTTLAHIFLSLTWFCVLPFTFSLVTCPDGFGVQEGAVPCVLDDVLRLQGSCTDARNEFGERAAAVLREAVVSGRGNIAHLPVLQINGCLVDVAPIAATDPGTAQRAIGAILQVCIPAVACRTAGCNW